MQSRTDAHLSAVSIDLTFYPTWPYIRVVREFVNAFCRVSFDRNDPDLSERVSSTASELVENAVKYSVDLPPSRATRITIELAQKEEEVILEVQNQTSEDHLIELKQNLAQSANKSRMDLQEMYRQKMMRASEDGSTSQLGLIRILWEWQAEKLEMETKQIVESSHLKGEKILVRALFKVGRNK